jgi:hypothetical protein
MRQIIGDVWVSSGEKPDYSDAKQLSSGEVLWTVSWSSDGKVIAEQDATIKVMGLDGVGTSLPAEKDTTSQNPHGCPDGLVVFTRTIAKDGTRNLWVSVADGTGLRQLTTGKFDDLGACSPDGKWGRRARKSVSAGLAHFSLNTGSPTVCVHFRVRCEVGHIGDPRAAVHIGGQDRVGYTACQQPAA